MGTVRAPNLWVAAPSLVQDERCAWSRMGPVWGVKKPENRPGPQLDAYEPSDFFNHGSRQEILRSISLRNSKKTKRKQKENPKKTKKTRRKKNHRPSAYL